MAIETDAPHIQIDRAEVTAPPDGRGVACVDIHVLGREREGPAELSRLRKPVPARLPRSRPRCCMDVGPPSARRVASGEELIAASDLCKQSISPLIRAERDAPRSGTPSHFEDDQQQEQAMHLEPGRTR